jgi:hypothetical protein
MAFAPQIGQNHGLQLFCPTSFAQPYASAKTCYALHPHRQPLFRPLSSEAVLLMGKKIQ